VAPFRSSPYPVVKAPQVRPVQQELPVPQDQPEALGLRVTRVTTEIKAQQARPAPKASKVYPAPPVVLERLAQQAPLELRVTRVILGTPGQQALPDHKV